MDYRDVKMTLTERKDRATALAERIEHLVKERNILDDRLWIMREELKVLTGGCND